MADIENLPYHRKYRPNTFKGYIGNEKLKSTMMSALAKGARPQSILLWGDSGCGKTTMARLLAKEYECYDRDPENGACEVCPNCITINEYIATGDTGMLSSIKEIDIGSNSGKNDIESVLSDVELASFGDEWKIYIFDEVQKASEALQTRLLKITEEPPERVLFIFCTTNPEKLLDTLKNRCQIKGHVTKPNLKELVGLLRSVCQSEGVDYDKKGLELIATRSEFTIRTSLQNLWSIVMEHNSAKYECVSKVFEEVSSKQIVNFFKFLKSKDIFSYVTLLHEVKSKMDLSVFLTELRSFTVRGIYIANGLSVEGVSDNELPVYRNLFGDMTVEELGVLLNKLLSMNLNNLELEFLLLGYTGLVHQTTSDGIDDIPEIENEVNLELANANKVVKEEKKQSYEQGIENAESMMESIGLESLFGMGAVKIDETNSNK